METESIFVFGKEFKFLTKRNNRARYRFKYFVIDLKDLDPENEDSEKTRYHCFNDKIGTCGYGQTSDEAFLDMKQNSMNEILKLEKQITRINNVLIDMNDV